MIGPRPTAERKSRFRPKRIENPLLQFSNGFGNVRNQHQAVRAIEILEQPAHERRWRTKRIVGEIDRRVRLINIAALLGERIVHAEVLREREQLLVE